MRWNRSILPVVVGDAGAVSRWVMPFSRQIRSNSTSVGLPEPAGEHLAVVGEDFVGHAIGPQRRGEHARTRPGPPPGS